MTPGTIFLGGSSFSRLVRHIQRKKWYQKTLFIVPLMESAKKVYLSLRLPVLTFWFSIYFYENIINLVWEDTHTKSFTGRTTKVRVSPIYLSGSFFKLFSVRNGIKVVLC